MNTFILTLYIVGLFHTCPQEAATDLIQSCDDPLNGHVRLNNYDGMLREGTDTYCHSHRNEVN